MILETKKIDFISIGIIVLLIVFGYLFFIKDGWATLSVLKEQEAVLSENVSAQNEMAIEMERIGDEINDIQKNLELFDRQLPKEKRIHDFLVEIDNLAQKNKVQLEGITPGNMQKGALYRKLPISIKAVSGFRDFYTFLFQLENIPRITMTEGLSVTRFSKDKSCTIELNLAVFVGSA
ncbi:MAG: type 4a pilus biogenesis protein PilO [Nitrospiraceae bacterium]|nr:MAG: type 4a pilus biogenesis protein PilO [Nitrospiraceae bacterium]